MDEIDIRDRVGRSLRILHALAAGVCSVVFALAFASHLEIGDHALPVQQSWFLLATATFAGLLGTLGTLALLTHQAKRRWHTERARAVGIVPR